MKQYMAESLLLLMEDRGYAEITIDAITRKAGVNRSTYYRNFSSKEDVIQFFLTEVMQSFVENCEDTEMNSLPSYLDSLFRHFYQYRAQLVLIYQNALFYLALEVFNKTFESRQPDRFHSKRERYDLYYHIGGIYNFFVLWLSRGMADPPGEVAEIAAAMFPPGAKPKLFS